MTGFDYVIQEEIGIHARPAGLLVKKAKEYDARISITCNERSAELTKLMAIMSLGVKCGDRVTVAAEGPDAEKAAKELEEFFRSNL